ncbi:MAG: M1 family metallopeptidase [Thiotrichales bacterium]
MKSALTIPPALSALMVVGALFALVLAMPVRAAAEGVIEHDLLVRLDPVKREIEVRDRITLPEHPTVPAVYEFGLHRDLRVVPDGGVPALKVLSVHEETRFYQIPLAPGQREVIVNYAGQPPSRPLCDWLTERCALFDRQGVYLDGGSVWYPRLTDELVTFKMRVELPEGWHAISQGEHSRSTGADGKPLDSWRIDRPQEDIYLVAGPFHVYEKPGRQVRAKVYLREPDEALAQRYLDVTETYIDRFARLFGAYPYAQFAAVESFWETGWGMPSFTLLGSRVMRLPFILHSAFPHEILHNWWGNSVYLDTSLGNWAEGLTAYLADHAIQEDQGQGAAFRRAALQKYADYVRRDQETSIRQFRSRRSDASQAIGYQKSLMMWHMLRRELGDDAFFAALQSFHARHLFRVASFVDLQRAFEGAQSGRLNAFFAQWLERAGAPQLVLGAAEVHPRGDQAWLVRMTLRQTQPGSAYMLAVPYRVLGRDGEVVGAGDLALDQPEQTIDVVATGMPATLVIDPDFDVFRRLDPRELPPSLGQLFGAERATVVVPARAEPTLRAAYQALAELWRTRYPTLNIVDDTGAEPPPGMVWVLGWENRYADTAATALTAAGLARLGDDLRLGDRVFARQGHTLVASASRDAGSRWGLLASTSADAVAALASRVTHYGKYGYLVFSDADGANLLKGEWTPSESPLTKAFAH